MKLLRTALVVTSLFFVAACSSTSNSTATNGKAMNATCPVSGKAIDGDSPVTTFDGKTIGFCCNNCVSKFNGMPNADKQAKITGSMPSK
jgi:YHS domain-containing protein